MINTEQLDDVQAHAQRIVDAAPPLTDYQCERLRPLLAPIISGNAAGVTGNARVPARVTTAPLISVLGNG